MTYHDSTKHYDESFQQLFTPATKSETHPSKSNRAMPPISTVSSSKFKTEIELRHAIQT